MFIEYEWHGDNMGRKFYVILVCLLSCSVILLGLSYSKQSSDNTDTGMIETNKDGFRVVYSTEDRLDTIKENKVNITVINKKNSNTSYGLYLNEIDEDMYENIQYTIDGINYYALTDNIIDLGTLSSYGTVGDIGMYTVILKSSNNYIFDYYVDEVSYDS